jgi:hypothetical protein
MAVTQEMVLMRIEDIGAYAEARALLRAVAGHFRAAGPERERSGLAGMRLTASALCCAVAEALRSGSPREEIRRLRDAAAALTDLRTRIFHAYVEHELDGGAFDELMATATRCRAEVDRWEAHTRHRARRQIDFGE